MTPLEAGSVTVKLTADADEALARLREVREELEAIQRLALGLNDTLLARDGYELVRVSREMVNHLTQGDSAPVVVLGINRYEDGTLNLVMRNPASTEDPS